MRSTRTPDTMTGIAENRRSINATMLIDSFLTLDTRQPFLLLWRAQLLSDSCLSLIGLLCALLFCVHTPLCVTLFVAWSHRLDALQHKYEHYTSIKFTSLNPSFINAIINQ